MILGIVHAGHTTTKISVDILLPAAKIFGLKLA